MKLNTLKEQRHSTLAAMKHLVDQAASADRDLNASESKKFDELKSEERSLLSQIERAEYLAEAEKRSAAPVNDPQQKEYTALGNQISVLKVLQAQMEGRSITGAEAEYSAEAERRSGRKAQGLFIPMSALETRANDTTSAAQVVGTDHRPDQYIGALRNRLLARQLGVRVLSGLQGDVAIPKYGSGLTTGWVTEGSAVSDGDMTFSTVSLTPKHVGGKSEMSRQLIQQSSPGIEQLLRDDLSYLIAQQIDQAIISGDGAGGAPTGILNTSGIQTHSMATPTLSDLHTMIELAELANVMPNHWLAGTSTKRVLATTVKETGVDTYLYENGSAAGINLQATNQLANKTGAPDTGRLILGDFSQVMLGIWSEIDLLVNPYAEPAYSRGGVVVRAMASCDVAVRHPEAFVVADDITL